MDIHNNTEFELDVIAGFKLLGTTVNKWRERDIKLYQHPKKPDHVISDGITFDGKLRVIADETKLCWATALMYAERGEVYISG